MATLVGVVVISRDWEIAAAFVAMRPERRLWRPSNIHRPASSPCAWARPHAEATSNDAVSTSDFAGTRMPTILSAKASRRDYLRTAYLIQSMPALARRTDLRDS